MKKTIASLVGLLFLCCWTGGGMGEAQKQSESNPPILRDLPDITVLQNSPVQRLVDLWEYMVDEDTPKEKILFNLITPYKPYWSGSVKVTLEENRFISVQPEANWTGEETVVIEANDGLHMDYDVLHVTVSSIEAGTLIEAEDDSRVERTGNWMSMSRWMRDGLGSNEPGDSLKFAFEGSYLAVSFWGQGLITDQVYYRHPISYQPWAVRKTYKAGSAVIYVDGRMVEPVDLSQAHNQGWSEISFSGLDPGTHNAEISVKDGFVFVDRIRYGKEPFTLVKGSVVDTYGTPLADIRIRYISEGQPNYILRTSLDGKIPLYCGLKEGAYSVVAEADSSPGYYRPPNPEENILPKIINGIVLKNGTERSFSFVLDYIDSDYRSLTIIRRPLGTVPSIVRLGDPLRVECRFSQLPGKVQVVLVKGHKTYPLNVLSFEMSEISNGFEKGLVIEADIPNNMPTALFDLQVDLDGKRDTARRAVKVLSEFKNAYRFAHLSDLHIRSPKDNRDHEKQLLSAAEEINRLSPEFVFLTGDITDSGSRPEYLRFIKALNTFDIPTYVIPGNHDFYGGGAQYYYEGEDEYRKYVGPPFYSFSYGKDVFVAVNTGSYSRISDTLIPGLQEDQWGWLIEVLEEARDNPGRLLVLLAHWDYTQEIGEFYPSYNQFESLFKNYPIDAYMCGHRHSNIQEKLEGTGVLFIQTGSLIRGDYRMIEVENARIVGSPTFRVEIKKESK